MLNFGNGSYQQELDRYFKILNQWEIAERVVYKSNFTKARSKLKYDAFTELNNSQVQYFYDHFPHQTWHGFNLLAIDGTTVRVPEHDDIMDHFGVWNSAKGRKPCPKARVSQMFDVLNKITIDAVISPKKVGERELANFHFMKLMHDDLVLMDRGYPAYWLFNAIGAMKANFCARVSHKKWKIVKKFYKSGQFESIIKLKSSLTSKRKSIEMGLETGPMKVRLIRVPLDTGKTEILMTSLLDKKLYPAEEFKSLYHLRWPVGVSSKGHIIQSVKVRPGLKGSDLVAWEAPWRERKMVKPSDKLFHKETMQGCRPQRAVNADVASLHSSPVAETVYHVRRQQEPFETSLMRRFSPAGYQRWHATRDYVSTGEALGVRRRNLVEEALPITVSGKWERRRQGGGSGCSTVDRCAAKRTGRKGPEPVNASFDCSEAGVK